MVKVYGTIAFFCVLLFVFLLFHSNKTVKNEVVDVVLIEPNKFVDIGYNYTAKAKRIEKLFTQKKAPEPGDWLFFRDESGQKLSAFVKKNKKKRQNGQSGFLVGSIGKFEAKDSLIFNKTIEYIRLMFGMELVAKLDYDFELIPDSAKRMNDGVLQINAKHILYEILEKQKPANAISAIAISNIDLYPRKSWNFVFGLANTKKALCVASFARHKGAFYSDGFLNLTQVLKSYLRTASHEFAHSLGILHCTKHNCFLNGAMSMEEANRNPLYPCPECAAKVCFFQNRSLEHFYWSLSRFYNENNFNKEALHCQKVAFELISK